MSAFFCWIDRIFLKSAVPVFAVIIMLGSGCFPDHASARDAADKTWSIGLRAGNLFEVDDAPVNSMPMVVCYVGRSLNRSWSALLSLDSFIFDVEGTADILGKHTGEEPEILGKMSLITASMEYVLCQEIKSLPIQPYVQAGVGIGFVDFDEDDKDSDARPGLLDIEVDADNSVEFVPTVSIGVRYALKSRWFIDAGTRFDYHISRWTVRDRNSGQEVRMDNFSALGAYAGFGMDF